LNQHHRFAKITFISSLIQIYVLSFKNISTDQAWLDMPVSQLFWQWNWADCGSRPAQGKSETYMKNKIKQKLWGSDSNGRVLA
jgi:hypothetical protein